MFMFMFFKLLIGPGQELSTLRDDELVKLSKKQIEWTEYLGNQYLEKAEFIASKVTNIELRLDLSHGKPSDVLRHLKQVFLDFSPTVGGPQLFSEFITSQKWSFLSGFRNYENLRIVSWSNV